MIIINRTHQAIIQQHIQTLVNFCNKDQVSQKPFILYKNPPFLK